MMTLVVISVNRDIFPPHTNENFEEWIKYNIGELSGISVDNPLSDFDMDAIVREISN